MNFYCISRNAWLVWIEEKRHSLEKKDWISHHRILSVSIYRSDVTAQRNKSKLFGIKVGNIAFSAGGSTKGQIRMTLLFAFVLLPRNSWIHGGSLHLPLLGISILFRTRKRDVIVTLIRRTETVRKISVSCSILLLTKNW